MTTRLIPALVCAALLSALPVFAQQPTPTPPAPRPAQPPSRGAPPAPGATATAPNPPAPRGQPINVKAEVTITDQNGGAPPRKKTVTIVTGDMLTGSVRTTADYGGGLGAVPLNVDVRPTILSGGKLRTSVNLQYTLPVLAAEGVVPSGNRALTRTIITETLELILEDGKSMLVAQSADPVGDRQVTVEIKATILK